MGSTEKPQDGSAEPCGWLVALVLCACGRLEAGGGSRGVSGWERLWDCKHNACLGGVVSVQHWVTGCSPGTEGQHYGRDQWSVPF